MTVSVSAPSSPKTLVAVIDSGISPTLAHTRIRDGCGFVGGSDPFSPQWSPDATDSLGHGTSCARIILAMNESSDILPIKVFERQLETSAAMIVAALRYAVEAGVKIANLSLATTRPELIPMLYAACAEARKNGVIIVAAAQNVSHDGFPATFADVIGVRAVRALGLTQFLYSADAAIECGAAGTGPTGPKERAPSTNSFAAARITGILAPFVAQNPSATIDDVRDWLEVHTVQRPANRALNDHRPWTG